MPETVWSLLAEADHATPFVEDGAMLRVEDVRARAAALAGWLVQAGVQPGDRVALHLPRSADEAIISFAIWAMGGVVVNLNYQWTADQLAYAAADCAARVLLTTKAKGRALHKAGHEKAFEHVLLREEGWPEGAAVAAHQGQGEDLAALLYTSGSTGNPKGVMVTHKNLLDGARIVTGYLGLRAADRILGLLPPSFDYGLNQILGALYVGAVWVAHSVPFPAEIAKAVAEKNISVLPLVAPSWVALSQYLAETQSTLPGVRLCTNTGGKITDSALAALPGQFPGADIVLMYGLTEAFRSTYLPPEMYNAKRGSMGRAIPDVQVFVVDAARGLCAAGEVGELVHTGALISKGYWNKPEASAAVIHPNPHLAHIIGNAPACHSGDLVRADEDGILWYVGRADGMIKSSGFRMSPTEIEDILCACPGVKEAVAWGRADDALGQVVVAAIYGDADDAALAHHIRAHMPSYMQPAEIKRWDTPFPRTGNGKIDRGAVSSALR